MLLQRLLFDVAALAAYGLTVGPSLPPDKEGLGLLRGKGNVCSSYRCPRHYSLVAHAHNKVCHHRGCDKRQCCEKDDKVCLSYKCPHRYSLVDHAHNKVCHRRGCNTHQCCEKNDGCSVASQCGLHGTSDKVCSSCICQNDYSLIAGAEDTVCHRHGCTDDLCCDEQELSYCSFTQCTVGTTRIEDASSVKCDDNKCETSQCCAFLCSGHTCSGIWTIREDPEAILCGDAGCTDEICYEVVC